MMLLQFYIFVNQYSLNQEQKVTNKHHVPQDLRQFPSLEMNGSNDETKHCKED